MTAADAMSPTADGGVMWGQRILNSGDEVWDATVNGSANRRVGEEVTLSRTVP